MQYPELRKLSSLAGFQVQPVYDAEYGFPEGRRKIVHTKAETGDVSRRAIQKIWRLSGTPLQLGNKRQCQQSTSRTRKLFRKVCSDPIKQHCKRQPYISYARGMLVVRYYAE